MITNNQTVTVRFDAGGFLLGLLGIAFVVLKLTGVIAWSWWWVTLPFWGGLVLMLVILAIAFLLIMGGEAWSDRKLRKRYAAARKQFPQR